MAKGTPIRIQKAKDFETSGVQVKKPASNGCPHEPGTMDVQLIEVVSGKFQIIVKCSCGAETVINCESLGE